MNYDVSILSGIIREIINNSFVIKLVCKKYLLFIVKRIKLSNKAYVSSFSSMIFYLFIKFYFIEKL